MPGNPALRQTPEGGRQAESLRTNKLNTEKIVPFKGQDGGHLAVPSNREGVITPALKNLEARDELGRLVQTGHLRPHRLAEQIYGKFGEEEDALLESVKSQGILTPLLVTPDGTVVAGSQRLRVANELRLLEVPVRVLDLIDAAEIEEKLIESNVARQKTEEQKIREYRELKRIEAGKAAARKGTRNDLMENLPSGQIGAARDLAAVKIGWSGRKAENGAKVLHAIEAHAEGGDNMQDVEGLRTTLNECSVDAAYQKAVEFGWITDGANRQKARCGSTPERRIAGVYRQVSTAVVKIARIFSEEDAEKFSPEQNRQLRNALTPVLKWVDGLGRA